MSQQLNCYNRIFKRNILIKMVRRQTVSKKLQFEVFKRDKFTCQCCGRKAPDVILNVCHINPISMGGENSLLNLITNCVDCNNGKRDKILDDKSFIEKRRLQSELLQEQREQIALMFEWQKSLSNLEDDTVNLIVEYVENKISPYSLNESGKRSVRKWINDFSVNEILDAIEEAAKTYLKYDKEKLQIDSVELFISKISGIIVVKNMPPIKQKIAYIKGIARNRFSYWDDKKGAMIINNYVEALEEYGWTEVQITNDLETEVIPKTKGANSWSEWRDIIEDWIEDIKSWERPEKKKEEVILSTENIESYALDDISSTKNKIETLLYIGKAFPDFNEKSEEGLKIEIFRMIYDFVCRQEELYAECNTIPDVKTISDELDNPIDKYFVLPDDYMNEWKPLSWGALFGITQKNDYLIHDNLPNVYNSLIHSIYQQPKRTKETNWKQKFKKTPNCKQEKTKINVERNGKLPMLSF